MIGGPAFNVAESALYYYRARTYDPKVGRFLQQDPEGPTETDQNLYAYVGNNPIGFIDPFGRWKFCGGATGPLNKDLEGALTCFDSCRSRNTCVTSGYRPTGPHSRGDTCDIGRGSNADLSRADAQRCFTQCFPNTGYGQEEKNCDGANTHFHLSTSPSGYGTRGFADGVVDYGKAK
jgi:RHS repeat-associated protein